MSQSMESLFRVYNLPERPVGAGFLVDERLGITCYHVIKAAVPGADVGAEIKLDFPRFPGCVARVIFCDQKADIAVLELTGELPEDIQPVPLVAAPELWGDPFRAFGFPKGHADGVWAYGLILQRNASDWVQIEETSTTGYAVQPGFSGAAVWDENLNGVVGMIVAADSSPEVRAAFFLPVDTIAKVWTALNGRVTQAKPGGAVGDLIAPAPGDPPYMGMRFFDTADAELFYGRAALSQQLVDRLEQEHFLAIVGASGSGKSSVARAGLIPDWQSGIQADGSEVFVVTPTAHPLESLAVALTQDSPLAAPTADLIEDLAKKPGNLRLHFRKRFHRTGKRSLLLVDQFEEAFTLCKDADERRAFIDSLICAAPGDDADFLSIVITLRADFYHHCAEYEGLRVALEKHQAFIGAMTADELRQAIEGPAQANGWEFEPGLVDLILRDVGEEPGALPLLSHALLETWRRRQGHRMTLAGYAGAGGVRKAIALTAESVYARLTPAEQAITRSIFLRLTEPGEGVQDTRRRVSLDELALVPEQPDTVNAVIRTLADARLVTTAQDSAEVAHEALIREWPTLRRWLEEDREGLRLHHHLAESAREWERRGKKEEDLYKGSRLAQAQEWSNKNPRELNLLEHEFLNAALAAAERAEAEREEARHRELEQAQKLARTQRQRAIVLLAGLFVAVALAALSYAFFRQSQSNLGEAWRRGTEAAQNLQAANNNAATAQSEGVRAGEQAKTAEAARNLAEEQSKLALSRQLGNQAQTLYNKGSADRETALLLAVQSMRLSPSLEMTRLLQNNTYALPVSSVTLTGGVNVVAFSQDSRYVASGSYDSTARVWEVTTGKEVAVLKHTGMVTAAVFGQANSYSTFSSGTYKPTSRYLITGSTDGIARVWEVPGGKEVASVKHDDSVEAVAISSDGRYVASGSSDGTVIVWEANSGKEMTRVKHNSGITSISLSPIYVYRSSKEDSGYLVTGSYDGTARVWALPSGKELARVKHEDTVTSVAFSDRFLEDPFVVSASRDSTVRVWDAKSGKDIARMNHDTFVNAVDISPDGRYVASGSSDSTVRVWDAKSGSEIARMTHDGFVNTVAFSPDGQYVVSGSMDGTTRVWEAKSGKEVARMTDSDGVIAAAFSPDGQYVVSGSMDGTARAWIIIGGKEAARMNGGGTINAAAFSPDGRYVVAGSTDGTAHVWETASGKEVARMDHGQPIWSAAFSPDSKYVITGDGGYFNNTTGSTARVWEIASGKEVSRMTHSDTVMAAAFSPDGKYVVTGSKDDTARVWEAASGKEVARMKHVGDVVAVAFSPDGKYVISGSADKTARVWEAASGKQVARKTHDDAVNAVAFSPDGKWVITGSSDGTAWVWEAATGKDVARVKHAGKVTAAAFSPDGMYVVTGSGDNTARVWEAASGREISRMIHDSDVNSVAFSPDGKYIISGSSDKTSRVWDVANGNEVARISHNASVETAAFSPDGRSVALDAWDSNISIWVWSAEELINRTCAALSRNLTRVEWTYYLADALPYQPTCPKLPLEAEPSDNGYPYPSEFEATAVPYPYPYPVP